mmetsp:Transcript_44945/g.70460  ORF Transcript_44945/g.70460 Transcript_44945/m.70460 type:complete len:479 (+) Transcript_44945:151-1587(+)
MASWIAGLLPIGMVGGCSTQLATCVACQACSCVGGACCSAICGMLGKGSPTKGTLISRWSRLTYLFLAILTIIAAGIFREAAPKTITGSDIISKSLKCPEGEDSEMCIARAFVLRMCFATFTFHAILGMFTIGANDYSNPRIQIHTALWPLKIGFWLVMHLAVLFMPADFFLGFGWFALIGAIFFLLVQIIIFIEWIYEWNESWIAQDGPENITGLWHMAILGVSFVAFGITIAMTVVMFLWFGKNTAEPGAEGGCEVYTFFTSFNLVMWFFLTLGSFKATEWMPSTGLMPSALVAAFMTFKVLTALYAQTKCNTFSGDDNGNGGIYKGPPEVLSGIAIFIAIVLAGYNSVMIADGMGDEGQFWGPSKPAPANDRNVPLVPLESVETQNTQNEETGECASSSILLPKGNDADHILRNSSCSSDGGGASERSNRVQCRSVPFRVRSWGSLCWHADDQLERRFQGGEDRHWHSKHVDQDG